MKTPLRVLHLEDNSIDAELFQMVLKGEGIDCAITRVRTRRDFQAALGERAFDVIVSDFSLPAFDGLSALKMARRLCPDKPFIFVTGLMREEAAAEALSAGALDYVVKDDVGRLVAAVRRAIAARLG